MEFKINKIDTDIRKKMQEEIKDDKVHSGKSINIKKDIKDETNERYMEAKNTDEEKSKKRYITVDGIKYDSKNIIITAEKVEEITNGNIQGRVLDEKK